MPRNKLLPRPARTWIDWPTIADSMAIPESWICAFPSCHNSTGDPDRMTGIEGRGAVASAALAAGLVDTAGRISIACAGQSGCRQSIITAQLRFSVASKT